MTLTQLIAYFRNGGSYQDFCNSQILSIDAEVIGIYMEKPFDLSKELAFFEIEKTEGKIEYRVNELKYFNFFDFYYFLDAIEESNYSENKSFTDNELAKKLLDYAINDA